jgi:hypothetical protein
MMRLNVLACVLLLTNVCHAVAVMSNGTGGGMWSEPETWAGAVVPGNGDSVTIVAGDIVTFDIDMSGWATGIAGLTCDGTMNCSTSVGRYCLKTDADIGGTGSINCGSPETAYPSNCVMTFDLDSKPNSFECGSGLTLNLHCTRPTHPTVALSRAGAVGQTELSIDTDVSGDIWAPGKTIRINAVSGDVPDSEERVIGADGIASGTITVDVGLTNAKGSGAEVVLVTRNIRIIGSTGSAVRYMVGGVLDCEISGCSVGVSSSAACTISGTISGCSQGVSSSAACTVSSAISGCGYGVGYPSGCLISGTISACYAGVFHGSDCVISSIISGCSSGIYAGSNTIQDAAFGGNRYDLRRVVSGASYNTLFGSVTENYEYDTDHVLKAWTRGGAIVSDVNIAPPGYAASYRHMCTSAAMPCFRQELFTVGPGQILRVQGKILILDNHDAWPPRLELVDVRADPLVDATAVPLTSALIPKPRGRYHWQDVALSYGNDNTAARQVWIRCVAQQAGAEVYEVWSADLGQTVSP